MERGEGRERRAKRELRGATGGEEQAAASTCAASVAATGELGMAWAGAGEFPVPGP